MREECFSNMAYSAAFLSDNGSPSCSKATWIFCPVKLWFSYLKFPSSNQLPWAHKVCFQRKICQLENMPSKRKFYDYNKTARPRLFSTILQNYSTWNEHHSWRAELRQTEPKNWTPTFNWMEVSPKLWAEWSYLSSLWVGNLNMAFGVPLMKWWFGCLLQTATCAGGGLVVHFQVAVREL